MGCSNSDAIPQSHKYIISNTSPHSKPINHRKAEHNDSKVIKSTKSVKFIDQQQNKGNNTNKTAKSTQHRDIIASPIKTKLGVVEELDGLENVVRQKREEKGRQFRQINEENENEDAQNLQVIINNEKKKMNRKLFANNNGRKQKGNQQNRSSIENDSRNISNLSNRNNESLNVSKIKMATQPSIIPIQINRQSFKKPLKLLKKKLHQKKLTKDLSRNSHQPLRKELQNLNNLYEKPRNAIEVNGSTKRRSATQQQLQGRELVVINTHLAQAERDRYMVQQNLIKRHRQAQKMKWQQQLKRQSQVYKRQFAYRYGYKTPIVSNQ